MKSEKNAAPPQNDSFEEDELPDGWERVSLSQISELIMGQSPPGSTYNTEGVGIPFFQGKTDFTEKSPIVRIWCTQPKKFAKSGDILISVRAPVGPTNIADRDCSIGRGLAAIRPKNGIPTEFILYYLKFKEPELALSGKGSTFTAIKKEDLTNLLIPLPPLPEQHRIVARVEALLTHVNAARERLSQVPLIMKRFRQGVLAAACSGRLTEGWREENPDVEPASDLLKNDNSDRKKKKRAGRLWGAGVIPELTDEECDLLPLSWTWTKVKEIGEDPDGTVQVGPMSMQSKTFTEKGVPVLNVGCVQWGYFDE
jgi:type I restriction enzyme S subunit